MNLQMDVAVAKNYRSASQIARVLTEDWMLKNGYCPLCLSNLNQSKSNSQVLDFRCLSCANEFELKGKKSNLGKKVTDGAYSSMISRVAEKKAHTFIFLAMTKPIR